MRNRLGELLKVKVKEGLNGRSTPMPDPLTIVFLLLFPHHVSDLSLHRAHTSKKGERSCF